jgi:hypothetical protein
MRARQILFLSGRKVISIGNDDDSFESLSSRAVPLDRVKGICAHFIYLLYAAISEFDADFHLNATMSLLKLVLPLLSRNHRHLCAQSSAQRACLRNRSVQIRSALQGGEKTPDPLAYLKVLKSNNFPSHFSHDSTAIVCNQPSESLHPRLADMLEVIETEVTQCFLNRSENFFGIL